MVTGARVWSEQIKAPSSMRMVATSRALKLGNAAAYFMGPPVGAHRNPHCAEAFHSLLDQLYSVDFEARCPLPCVAVIVRRDHVDPRIDRCFVGHSKEMPRRLAVVNVASSPCCARGAGARMRGEAPDRKNASSTRHYCSLNPVHSARTSKP